MSVSDEEAFRVSNPCLRCGACCSYFRISFYWAEVDEATPEGIPTELTERLTPFRGTMRRDPAGRCAALLGTPGLDVRCAIYERRPTPCRDYEPAWTGGVDTERCDRARARFGLPPAERPPREPSSGSPAGGE